MSFSLSLQVERGPVGNVEYEEDDGERDEHGHVELARLVLAAGGRQLSKRLHLHLEQDDRVLEEGAEYEENAADDPGLHRVQPVGLRGVGGGGVEDVDLEQEKEEEE